MQVKILLEDKMNNPNENINEQEYITIIAPSIKQAMAQFKARGLDVLGYSIVGQIVRQQFSIINGSGNEAMFDGEQMFSATWKRKS